MAKGFLTLLENFEGKSLTVERTKKFERGNWWEDWLREVWKRSLRERGSSKDRCSEGGVKEISVWVREVWENFHRLGERSMRRVSGCLRGLRGKSRWRISSLQARPSPQGKAAQTHKTIQNSSWRAQFLRSVCKFTVTSVESCYCLHCFTLT